MRPPSELPTIAVFSMPCASRNAQTWSVQVAQRIDDVIGTLGAAEADDVGGQHVELLGQRPDVVLPVGRCRHTGAGAVQHDDRSTGAGLEVAGFDASGIDGSWLQHDSMSSSLTSFLEHGKTLVGVEDIGGDELRPRRVQAEFVDRAGQTEPIEHFVLTGIDDVAAGGRLPRRVVAVDEQLDTAADPRRCRG